MGRAPCCEKVGLKRGKWTAEEDQILTNYIQAHGEGSWRNLPKNAGLLRCGKSCRLRWINYLRSDLKRGNVSPDEELLIINLHASLGNRWSLIAGHLPGRTDNEIKNYWNSHLSKKLPSFQPTIVPPLPPPPVQDAAANPGSKRPRATSPTTSKLQQPRPKKKKPSTTPPPPPQPVISPEEKSNVTTTVPVPPGTPTLEKESLSTSCQILDEIEKEEEENIIYGLANLPSTSEFTSSVDDIIGVSEQGCTDPDHPPGMTQLELEGRPCEELLTVSDHALEDERKGSTTTSSSSSVNVTMEVSNDVNSWKWWDDDDGRDVFQNLTAVFGDKADMLSSWLWDVDEWDGPGGGHEHFEGNNNNMVAPEVVVDDEKQNAMVAWLLS